MTAYSECIDAAGSVLRHALSELESLPSRQAAEAAHYRGGPSIDELERRICAMRGMGRQAAA